MTDPIISLLKFPFHLKDDQIDAATAWMDNGCRGTILYSTGTGKTEISFECARRLVETYKKNNESLISEISSNSPEGIHHLTNQNDISSSFHLSEKNNDAYTNHDIPSRPLHPSYGDSDSDSNYSISFFNILFLVPRVSLINQTINRLIKYNIPKEKIGGYFGERKEVCEIIVGTFHSVIRNPILIKRSNMVIIDEVHLIKDTSSSFKKIFDFLVEDPKKAILGLTATLDENDFRNNSILTVLPPLRKYPLREAVIDNRLAKPVIIPISVSLTDKEVIEYDTYCTKIKNISNKFKRYDAKSMTLLLKKGGFVSGMAKAWFSNVRKRKLLLSYNENKLFAALDIIKNRFPNEKIMVFSETLESIERLRDLLSQHSIDSKIIDAKVKSKARSNILERWGNDFNVLLSIHTLELGVDVPQVRIEIILATTSDINQIVQRIGRVLRLIEGKTIGLIYIIYVDDTTDNKVLGVINQAMNPNTSLKPNRSMSYQHLAKGSSVPFSSDSQQYNDTNKLGDLRKNNKTKTKGTKIQRAIRIVESSLDDSLVVEEAIKTEEDGNNFDTGTDTDINTTGTNSISNDNSYSITKLEKIFTVKSKTDKSKYYTVNIENNTCTCADFSYRKSICKHIIAAKLLSIY
ncbi:MAG: DEAD/DEAH box helicase family protein [Candidatus Nitrosocosmicus sp.]|nr:DEAD/DEAH box helicase family protein [Candidatus Nitrosocosmicus sp.]MDN5867075.1 DEAD/DEAH box helicase family protein [Candidatus Nitrosocosmicus sp.]